MNSSPMIIIFFYFLQYFIYLVCLISERRGKMNNIMESEALMEQKFETKAVMNETKMEQLIHDYGNNLLRLCTLYLKDRYLAEDALQEVYIRVWKKYSLFEGQSQEKTWMTRIAINVCKNYMRSPWHIKTEIQEISELIGKEVNEYQQIDNKIDLMEGILKLKEKYRVMILLYYYQELSVKEIAFVLNRKESTVLTHLKRAREQLKKYLTE